MEEDGDSGEDSTPFWLQGNANLPRSHQLRRRASAVFLSSGLVVFLLLLTALIFLVFVVPSTLSLSSQIFRPNGVKKSWDFLNTLLVLVAVLFGFLSKNKDEDRYPSSYGENQESLSSKQNESRKSNPSTPQQWFDFSTIDGGKSNLSSSDRWYDDDPDFESKKEYKNPILRRNSNSYPDLREFSSTRWAREDFQRRFDDDTNVGAGRAVDPVQFHRRHRSMEEVDHLRVRSQRKTVFVDTLVNKSMPAGVFPNSSHPPPYPPVLPSSPPPPMMQEKPNRAQETVTRKNERSRRKMDKDMETLHTVSNERTPTPHPPQPPPQQSHSKSDRKRGGSGGSSNATKDFLNSLYHKKKKKQRQKSVDNLDLLLHQSEAPLSFQLPPSSSPRSPSPPSVFQNLFSSKKHKRKRTIKVTVKSPSPAPPTTPLEPRNGETEHNPTFPKSPFPIHKPESFEKLAEIPNSGGESPLNRVPPPPPPPPFLKRSGWKFVVQGDYVRVDSVNSSRSGSPDPEELESDNATETGNAAAAASHPPPLFCPSPDVDTKAESFITNFRAKLKLERHHSMRKSKELGLSSLGPSSGPT